MNKENNNNGLRNNFYEIEEFVVDVDDLSESLNLDGFQFNILKSLFGLNESRHNGTSADRDSYKILHYAIKNVLKLKRSVGYKIGDVLMDVISKLRDEDIDYIKNKINNL